MAKSGFQTVMMYNQEAIGISRQLGLSFKESESYTSVLIDRAEKLGFKYGIAADKVMELQKNLSEATGRAMMLNNQDAEKFVQYNKLVGSDTTSKFTSTITKNLGGQIQTVEGAVSKAYATAAKSGLNAAQFSQKVAENLSLANKLSFRNGIEGITKMTALSEKLGFNLQSVEAAANNFMEIDKAIENSAKLQMLGGAAGAYGSNPLAMAYESNYDPEAFTERMTKTLGGYATFDAAKGIANVNGMNRDFVKNIAQSMGISMDEAMTIAKKQAEVKYKESQFMPQLGAYGSEFKDFLTNKSYVKDGKLMITDSHGNERTVGGNGANSISADELKKMQYFEGMSDEEIMKQQALTLTSIEEKLTGAGTSLGASVARGINDSGVYKLLLGGINKAFPILDKIASWVGGSIGYGITEISHFLENNKDWIKGSLSTIASVIKGIYDFSKSSWKWVIGGIGALVAFFAGRHLYNLGKGGGKVLRTIRGAANASGKSASNILGKTFRGVGKGLLYGAKSIRSAAVSGGKLLLKGLSSSAKLLKSVGKSASNVLGNAFRGVGNSMKPFLTNAKTIARDLGAYGHVLKRQLFSKPRTIGWKGKSFKEGLKQTFFGHESSKGNIIGRDGYAFGKNKVNARRGIVRLRQFGRMFKPTNLLKTTGKILKSGAGLGIAGAIGNYAGDSLVNNGTIHNGGIAHSSIKTLSTAAEWASVGGMLGSVIPGIGNAVGAAIGGTLGAGVGIKNSYEAWKSSQKNANKTFLDYGKEQLKTVKNVASNALRELEKWGSSVLSSCSSFLSSVSKKVGNYFANYKANAKKDGYLNAAWKTVTGQYATGGIIGGTSYNGDKLVAKVNSGEMILNPQQQNNLFDILNSKYDIKSKPIKVTEIKAKPVGEKEYIHKPSRVASNNSSTITVKDINVNVSGTIKIDGGNTSQNIDVRKLLMDSSFVSSLKEMIKNSINTDMNAGRYVGDVGTQRGLVTTTSLLGRK